MKKKLLSLILAATMVASLLAGCGSTSKTTSEPAATETAPAAETKEEAAPAEETEAADGVQVGIVLPTKDEPRWLQDQAQFESILGDAGFTNQVLFSQGSSATEKTNVETLISQGIKVLIICAQDGAAAAAAVEEAKDAGITVIAYDRLITGTDAVDYYVTFDSFAVGAAQGQYLIDNAPEGTGVPLYLYAGAATDNNAFIFFEGAWSVLQPKIADGTFVIANSSEAVALQDKAELSREEEGKIIGQVTTDWDFNVAKSKAEAHLTAAGADMKGDVLVLAPNDGTARSIADVFATDKDVTSYVVTGQDSEKASVQYVIDGKQSMTVFKDTRTLASDSVAMAVSVLNGETPATDTTYNNEVKDVPAKQTAIVVVSQDNVKAALIDSGYYDASEFTGLE
ncbi:putative multiple sugar transport system substrate-binding protein [Kineothrix alysoides]|uniref:Putative multiple sugar transport system substrate-binding protein n=1 Tax=Kineothrix alysoides TaxID=1469948 RepID=A0A4R1QP27_9FIRM|nr:sugar-binding protein [Kineothrix alysoides]TCL54641.1 putative multiple sugar transport system substrate-binding protein [Kineothrix alysoides]